MKVDELTTDPAKDTADGGTEISKVSADKPRGQSTTRPARVLLPWLQQAEAVTITLGRMPNPGEDVSSTVAKWERQRKNVAARPAFDLGAPAIEPIPAEVRARADGFIRRPEVQAAFQPHQWELAVVDLRQVLSFQPMVMLDAEVRVAGAHQDDWDRLFSLCLPEQAAESLVGNIDQAGRAFTFTSANPNLRVAGQGTADVSSGQVVKLFGFMINFGTPFVQIAEYQGRLFVRDGYHRCYGLLRKGITRIPCVFVRARTFEEIGAGRPGFFGYDVLFSARPPFLADLLLDDFSATVQQRVPHKVIRIKAEEFLVNT